MAFQFAGRQTQFYIDVLYGIAFSLGFIYLLFVGMDARVAAFQGGLVFGYFLRVWENMTIYERILQEEIAEEAENIVPEEVSAEVEQRVPDEVSAKVEEQVPQKVEEQVHEEVSAEVEQKVPEEVSAEVEIPDEAAEQLAIEDRAELASDVEELLRDELDPEVADTLVQNVVDAVCARIEERGRNDKT